MTEDQTGGVSGGSGESGDGGRGDGDSGEGSRGAEPAPLTYPDVGGTRDGRVPEGFSRLSRATVAGRGRAAYDRLVAALLRWDVHRGAGLKVDADGAVAEGVEIRLGLPGPVDSWRTLLSCRVVYVVDELGRAGFGYGTLPGQVEEGEARFLVETDPNREDAPVTFTVDAFSRAGTERARSFGPLLRVPQEVVTQGYLRAARRAAQR